MKINKKMTNIELAELLRSVSAAYEIKGFQKNRFKIIAYDRAADSIEHLSSEAKDLWDDNQLDKVAGIGSSIAKHLGEIFSKGKSKHFKEVFSGIPDAVFELLPIGGIGPKTALKLVEELKITTPNAVKKLLKNAESGMIENLEGFGKDSQDRIIASIKQYSKREKRYLINYAERISFEVIAWMKKSKGAIEIDQLGSLRRKASTIGDIDISVSTINAISVIKHFVSYPKANRILEKGTKTASIILPGNVQVDLMVQDPDSYGALLQHFTGSKHHNIALREYALKKGLSLSEYGIKKLKEKSKKIIKFKTEKEFYEYLGMEWIPPEIREDLGEIRAAINQKESKQPGLPKLVEETDIKADLQIHSDFDIETSHDLGESTMLDIVKKADDLGYEYIAFTEHNPSHSKHNNNQISDLLKRKRHEVEKVNDEIVKNSSFKNIKRVFNSLEIDILPDGKLPLKEDSLEILDFALVSIHSSFNLDKNKMTQRVIRGLSHQKCKIFAHPTARRLNEREGVELDWEAIFEFCSKNNKWLEVNADPMRLDLPDYLVKKAKDNKVKLTLGTDAHHKDMMDNMRFGVYVARRGWAERNDLINTHNLEEFVKMI